MSVVITNISEQYNKEYGRGKQHYVLGINHLKFVEFEHNFEDGLATCLRKAADAFEKLEAEGKPKIYEKNLYDSYFESIK
jgi:hypothetical protein